MDHQVLGQGIVTIAVGAVSGGITNAVAIWMLFHPYESRGIGRLRIQGAIPKNKARLAKSIGRTVGERLLTPEDLASRPAAPAERQAFDEAIGHALAATLDRSGVRSGSSSVPIWLRRWTKRWPPWRRAWPNGWRPTSARPSSVSGSRVG
jgi:uncharacterized membrane protein YheB (UPF0754 family)